ncbi:hypothetical protein BH10ACI3_BH10ACI3_06290 [soil metagenome]
MNRKGIVVSIIVGVVIAGSMFSQTSNTPARNEADLLRRMQDMRALDSYSRRQSDKDKRDLDAFNPPVLDKKTKERIKQMRLFDNRDIERYSSFLTGQNTGIVKLFPNFECVAEKVIRIDGDCTNFVPESSDFSFRTVTYTNHLYHDIGYERSGLVSDAFFSQGIFTTLGDVPIEKVDQNTPGVSFLLDFVPETKAETARRRLHAFDQGLTVGGARYSRNAEPDENMTYAMRVIAYKVGNSLPPITDDSTMLEIKFKSLEMDKRDDITVAFRIIRVGNDRGLTIVWKELDRKDAPKIKFASGEILTDFK